MTEIKMKKNVDDLRSIYYRENQQKYFFGPKTKRQSINLLIALVLFPLVYLIYRDNLLLIIGSVIIILVCYDFWRVAKPIIVWKKSVETFLKKVENTNNIKFVYDENYFVHIQDNEELKQNWTIISKVIVADRYIWLFSDTNILLPKSSMSDDEFNALSQLISRVVKNVVKF